MTAYYNEFDPKAAAWLRELIRCGLIADGVVDERSILEVKPDDLRGFTQCHFFAGIGGWSYTLRLAGWPDDRPVWTGSPPCQPFSSAGQQKGQNDERHLAPHFAALVAECRPSILFGEQVASSAVFGKAASGARKATARGATPEWAWLDDLFERLEAAHYACGASDIPAAGIGAPHIRQRTFFGAVRLGRMGDSKDFCTDWGESGSMGSTQRAVQSQTRQGYGKTAGVAGGDEWLGHATSGRERPRFADDGRSGRDEGSDRAASDAVGLADSIDTGPQGRLRGWQDTQRSDQHGHAGRDGAAIGLVDAHCAGQQAERFDPFGSGPTHEAIVRGPTGGRLDGGLADAESAGRTDGSQIDGSGAPLHEARPEVERVRNRSASGGLGGLADAEHAERGPICQHREDGRNGPHSGREETHGVAGTRGEVFGLADTDGGDTRTERQQCGGKHGQQPLDGGAGIGLADTDGDGHLTATRPDNLRRMEQLAGRKDWKNFGIKFTAECSSNARVLERASTNAPDGPWGTADWLFCRDRKWRPVESSILGVADGVPAELVRSGAFVPASSPLAPKAQKGVGFDPGAKRVMRLRGYGNAINPWAAKVFIEAFVDTLRSGPDFVHCKSPLPLVNSTKRNIEDLL